MTPPKRPAGRPRADVPYSAPYTAPKYQYRLADDVDGFIYDDWRSLAENHAMSGGKCEFREGDQGPWLPLAKIGPPPHAKNGRPRIHDQGRVSVMFRMSPATLNQIDAVRGSMSRQLWINQAVDRALNRDEIERTRDAMFTAAFMPPGA